MRFSINVLLEDLSLTVNPVTLFQ